MFGKIMKWQETALILAATLATGTAVLVKSLVDNLYLDAPLYYYLSCEAPQPPGVAVWFMSLAGVSNTTGRLPI